MAFEIIIGIIVAIILLAIGVFIGIQYARIQFKQLEQEIRKDAIDRSRRTLGGKFAENLAPFLPDFKYDPTDIRFLGTPIDFIAFPGLATGEPEEIVLVEVKSGKAQLSTKERKIRDLVKKKKVRWELYRVDERVTE